MGSWPTSTASFLGARVGLRPATKDDLPIVGASAMLPNLMYATGHYRIALMAGTYLVRIPSARFGFKPRQVSVVAGQITVRNFLIDTGIR